MFDYQKKLCKRFVTFFSISFACLRNTYKIDLIVKCTSQFMSMILQQITFAFLEHIILCLQDIVSKLCIIIITEHNCSYALDLSLPVFGFFCLMVMDLIGQNRRRQLKICSERIAKVMIAFECGCGKNPTIKVWIQVMHQFLNIVKLIFDYRSNIYNAEGR